MTFALRYVKTVPDTESSTFDHYHTTKEESSSILESKSISNAPFSALNRISRVRKQCLIEYLTLDFRISESYDEDVRSGVRTRDRVPAEFGFGGLAANDRLV